MQRPPRPVTAALCALLVAMVTAPAPAHVVREEPWHPVAAAYLRALFYANLRPIDWDLIAREFEVPLEEPGFAGRTVYDLLSAADAVGGIDHEAEIRQTVQAGEPGAFYAAATRAISQLIRHHMERARERLAEPGAAQPEILEAQRLFRAFAQDYLEDFDAAAYDRLGRAWLEMSSSVGSPGVGGIGRREPDVGLFEGAHSAMESFLVANYETGGFVPEGRFAPVPAMAGQRITVREGRFGSLASVLREHRQAVLPPGSDLNDQVPLPLLRLNIEARGIDEAETFMIAYGDMLFDSPEILGEPARSLGIACSTCHNRSDINRRFFIPGVSHQPGAVDVDGEFFNPRFNDLRVDPLDIPSLRGIRFTAPFGRDGRTASLRDFIRTAIVNEFGGEEPTLLMLEALTAYLFEFDWLPNPYLAADGTLTAEAPEAARRGELLFHTPFEGMGNRACSTCHVPSNNFIDGRRHDIGSQEATAPGARDALYDTPTLLNVLYTAPYFHDGSLATLPEVVDWFDREHRLGLTEGERSDLTTYLETVGSAAEPWETFDAENTPFALDWDELSTFLATLDTLIAAEDGYHTELLLATVALDLRLDASAATNRPAIPKAYQVADKLDAMREAVAEGDWQLAAALNEDYKELAAAYGPLFR